MDDVVPQPPFGRDWLRSGRRPEKSPGVIRGFLGFLVWASALKVPAIPCLSWQTHAKAA